MAYETGNPDRDWIRRRNRRIKQISDRLRFWETEFKRLNASGESTRKAEERIRTLKKRLERLGYRKRGFLGTARWRKLDRAESVVAIPSEAEKVDVAKELEEWRADQEREERGANLAQQRDIEARVRSELPPTTPPAPPTTPGGPPRPGGFGFGKIGLILGLVLVLGIILYFFGGLFSSWWFWLLLGVIVILILFYRQRGLVRGNKYLGLVLILVFLALVFTVINYFGVGFIASPLVQWPFFIIFIVVLLLIFSKGFRDFFATLWTSIWNGITRFLSYLRINHPYVLLVSISVLVVIFISLWVGGNYLYSIFTRNIIQTLANLPLFSWIIGGIISILGIWLIFRTEKTGINAGKHTHWKLGLFLFFFGLFFGYYAPKFSQIAILSGAAGAIYSFRWIITIALIALGVYLLFSKNYKGTGIFLIILGVAFWFLVPFISSEIAQKYGLKGEIAVEESGFIPRAKRFFFYVQHPEEYFAKYGEFTNPNVQQKGSPKGLKIISFEPIISSFRIDQNIRLLAEVKNFAIPSFKDNEGRVGDISIAFSCGSFVNSMLKNGKIGISSSCEKSEIKDGKITGVSKNKDCTFFITCDFDKNSFEVSDKNKNRETIKAILNADYENFITESDLRTYVIGDERYNEILSREKWELELLNELRGAASAPGLINNDRKVTSQYTGGPVELAVNILNPQPIYPGNELDYTLFVTSKPNSVDWEGSVKPNSLFLSVPSWLQKSETCQFVKETERENVRTLDLDEEGINILKGCYEPESGGILRGCTFVCDFAVGGDNIQKNIEEYNIKAFQTSSYFLNKSTTFDIVDLKRKLAVENKSVKQEEKKTQCNDGVDNDGDGFCDGKESICGDGSTSGDAGCYDQFRGYSAQDDNEVNTLPECSDYFDNDGDGRIDRDDLNCHENSQDITSPYHAEYTSERGVTITR